MFWKKNKTSESNNSNSEKNSVEKDDSTELTKVLSPVSKVKEFTSKFHSELESINKCAMSNLTDWHAYLNELIIAQVSNVQREAAKASGLPLPKVAFPSEYRAVLELLKTNTKPELHKLQQEVKDDFDADDLLDEFVRRKFSSLIDDELGKYLEKSKPSVSVSDIFANASTSMNKYSVQEKDAGDKSYSIKCKTCGAARLEEDQYDSCFYCGSPLF